MTRHLQAQQGSYFGTARLHTEMLIVDCCSTENTQFETSNDEDATSQDPYVLGSRQRLLLAGRFLGPLHYFDSQVAR